MRFNWLTTLSTFAFMLFGQASSIYAQNLVQNGYFEAGNTGFVNEYKLWTGGVPGAGLYFVTNTAKQVYSGWGAYGDHTSGSGKLLVVDGSATSNSVLWRQTVTVQTNTAYVFSAWAMRFDSDAALPAVLYFAINGVQQGLAHPVNSKGNWEGFGATWNSGTSSTAILELRDLNGQKAAGNNLAVDDIAFIKFTDLPPVRVNLGLANGTNTISWLSYPGVPHQIQWASVAATNTWFNLGETIVGIGTTNSVSDLVPDPSLRFYRVIQSP